MSFEPQQTLSSMSAPSLRPPPWWSGLLAALGVFVCVACAVLGPLSLTNRPSPLAPGDVPEARALLDQLKLARPITSSARERALDVVENAMRSIARADVQRERGMISRGDMFVMSENVVATVHGTGGGARIVVVAHADSVPNVSGSGDDAFGVSIALAALRSVAREQLAGDVVVVITGQEEVCVVCGAKLWRSATGRNAKPADVVINIDSGGDAGPFAETQSTANSAPLFALLAPTPAFSSSLVDGFSRVFAPAEGRTELSAFARAPTSGIDLGLLGGRRCYHAPCDDVAHVDVAALPGAVATVTSIARAVASSPAGSFAAKNDAVLVALPQSTIALPGALAIAAVVLACLAGLAMAVGFAFKRFGDFAMGVGAFLAALLASVAVFVLVRAIAALLVGSATVVAQGPLVVGASVVAAFGVALLCTTALATRGLGSARTVAFAAGSSTPLVVLCAVSSFASLELGGGVAVVALITILGVVLAGAVGTKLAPVPLFALAFVVFTCAQLAAIVASTASDLDDVTVAAFSALLAASSASAVAPLAARTHPAASWLTSAASIAGAVALLAIAGRAGAFDASHPQPVSLSYAQSSTRAFLYTDDDAPAAVVSARLGPRAQPVHLDDVFPSDPRTRIAAAVPSASLAAPTVKLVDVKPTALGATWRLALYSNRNARDLRLTVHGDARAFRIGTEAAAPCHRASSTPCTLRIVGVTNALVDIDMIGTAPSALGGLDVTLTDVAPAIPAPYAPQWPAGVAPSASGDRSAVASTLRLSPR